MNLQEFDSQRELRQAYNRALVDLARQKHRTADLVEAVYQAAKDGIQGLSYEPVKPPPADKRKKSAEVGIVLLSDWQLAKITPTYSSEICEKRIGELAAKVVKLAEIQRADHPIDELRVYLLGDLVEGEMIFPGQSHLIDASLYRQVVADGPRILGNFLRCCLAAFPRVHVVGVIGNHGAIGGRARRESHPETNADAMMYEVTRLTLESEKRLTWAPNFTPGERHWYALDTVGAKTFMLFHGDQVRGGFAGMPWYGFGKKVYGWNAGAVPQEFDYGVCGHWHTPTFMTLNTKGVWVNGSTESYNTYAMEQLAAVGRPMQWLLFAHPERGVTSEHKIWLD